MGTFDASGWFRIELQRGCMDALKPERWQGISASLAALVLVAGCKGAPETRAVQDSASEKRGLALIKATGCGACHEIPGLSWPKGGLGPSLGKFDDTGLIAGQLPNTPANLAAFIVNAPAVKQGSNMPPMPLSASEAADIAAYLHGATHD